MISTCSFLFTVMLFSELGSGPVTAAMPPVKEVAREADGLGSVLDDEAGMEPTLTRPAFRRSVRPDNTMRDEEMPDVLLLSDTRVKGRSSHGLNSAFARRFADGSSSRDPADYRLGKDRRDTDLDMLRCMIGRVYRPCWGS